jgi:hypothetical protein
VTAIRGRSGLKRASECQNINIFNGANAPSEPGPLIIEVSRSHSLELLWTSDQPDAETST